MAFFGAPIGRSDHARRAVLTAREILESIRELESGERLSVGIGIASGEAFVGNVGGGEVTDYTVLGDTVNVAARLQGASAGGKILISDNTYAHVASDFPDARREELLLKGKSGAVVAWEITGAAVTRKD